MKTRQQLWAAWVWAAVGGCRASASATRCCACCEVKTWRFTGRDGCDPERLAGHLLVRR